MLNRVDEIVVFNKLKKDETRKLFMCSTGLPKRKNDVTHVNKKGAEEIAKLFVNAAKGIEKGSWNRISQRGESMRRGKTWP